MHKLRFTLFFLAVLVTGCSNATPGGKGQAQQEKKEIGSLDLAGDANGSATLTKGNDLRVAGWAADTAAAAPVQTVTVLVDGVSVGKATLGIARPDVAKYFGRTDYTNSGWSFQVSTSNLSIGQHVVTASSVGPSGIAQLGSKTITIQ